LALAPSSSNAEVPVTFGDIGYLRPHGGTDYHFLTGTSNTIGFAQRQTYLSFYWDDSEPNDSIVLGQNNPDPNIHQRWAFLF